MSTFVEVPSGDSEALIFDFLEWAIREVLVACNHFSCDVSVLWMVDFCFHVGTVYILLIFLHSV